MTFTSIHPQHLNLSSFSQAEGLLVFAQFANRTTSNLKVSKMK